MAAKFVVILALLGLVKSAKILVVSPTPSKSHHVVFRSLIQELVDRQHEVTALTTDRVYPRGGPPHNLREINLHNLSYSLWNKVPLELEKAEQSNLVKIGHALRLMAEIFIEQLKDQSVAKLLSDRSVKFDLLILTTFVPATLILSHIYKAPVILLSPLGAFPGDMEMMGSLTHPMLYPTHYHTKLYNITLWDKINKLYTYVAYSDLHQKQELTADELLRGHFGSNIPTLEEIKKNADISLFLNVHPLWVHNPPAPPNVAYSWGLHKQPEKDLPKDLQSYLDSSKHGVIYVSFGSVFRTCQIPSDIVNMLVTVFSRLPYRVLWKWDADELPGKSDNIKISKWLPQYDLLRHGNVKLFITHGGLRSTEEAVSAGVPLVGLPQFADQAFNTEKYLYFKIGLKLDYKSLTAEDLETAIMTILTDYDSYKSNIVKLGALMSQQPAPGLELGRRAELLLGGRSCCRAASAGLTAAQYYELELLLELLLLLLVLFGALYTAARRLIRLIRFKTSRFKIVKTQ